MIPAESTNALHILRLLLALRLGAGGIEASNRLLEIGHCCVGDLRAFAALKDVDFVAAGVLEGLDEAHVERT